MSGVEVVGLVFGVLPILIETIKAYATVADGLHTFRHYSKETKNIALKLTVQHGIFLNHCRLLLQLVETERVAEDMLDDVADGRWTSKELNDRLNAVLKNNLQLCRSIIEETKGVITEMRKEMLGFDELMMQKKKNEPIGSAIKRLRKAIKITFNKTSYERCLALLRDNNEDLNILRSQIGAFQQQPTTTTCARVKQQELPDRFHSIQSASHKLHEALCSAWCCDDTAHCGHYAKLCLDAKVDVEIGLDLAISCQKNSKNRDHSVVQEPPIWLSVQSNSIAVTQRALAASHLIEDLKTIVPGGILASSSPNSLKKKASSDLTPLATCKKKKRVQFVDPDAKGFNIEVPKPLITQMIPAEFNLCLSKSICNYLQQSMCDTSLEDNFLGYLETPCQMYKHKFYLRDKDPAKYIRPARTQQTTIYSIFDIMRHDPDEVLLVENQLKLAHKAALAILQFTDTPWMTQRWRLSDISYFGSPQIFDVAALKTLHLSSQLSMLNQSSSHAVAMEGVSETTVSDEIRYGINNLPLFFLGVALLEIAHWTPLESKMIPRDHDDQVYTARRLALGRAPLGPDYQKIVQKCLQCNFGFGTKLNSKSLQTAVYNDVICELDAMIENLSL